MKKIYIFLSIALGLFCMPILIAQQNVNKNTIFSEVDERVFLHANTTTLLTGETLYYTFYSWNTETDSLSKISKIGYVQLVNKNGKSLLKQKIALENGIGHGDFFIPTKWQTSSYKLVAYTRWMRNGSLEKMFQMDLIVINPFQPAPESTIAKIKQDSLQGDSTKRPLKPIANRNENPIFNLKKNTYNQREQVIITLSPKEIKSGNYSISVRKLNKLPKKEKMNSGEFVASLHNESEKKTKDSTQKQYLPELRGELLLGKITNKTNKKDVANKSIALSIPGKNFSFKIVHTNREGQFRFILDKFPRNPKVVIQVMEKNRENYTIELIEPKIDFSALKFEEIRLTPNLKSSIENRSVAVQIENAYYSSKQDSTLPQPEIKPFFYPFANEYILEEYTSFPSLEKTIVEIVPAMYATKENGNYEIHTRDYYNDVTDAVYGKTLVLVDGLLLQDVNKLFEYDTRKIHKISIVPRGYVYGPKLFEGVVSFVTKKQDFNPVLKEGFVLKKEILRPLNEKVYFNPTYSSANKNKRIPDYRYQLLWLPEIAMKNKPKEISFYTSDVTGTFEISVEGFTLSGEPVSIERTFTVK